MRHGGCLAVVLCAAGSWLMVVQPIRAEQGALVVATVTVASADVVRTLSLTGELQAHDTRTASFPTGGRIAEILVDDADTVAAGAVLARIERVQQEQSLRAAEAGLTSARADLAKAQNDKLRQDGLFERGATTRSERDAAADRFAAAAARLAQAEATLDRARKALDDTVLTAPAAGTVIRRLAEPGQIVGAAQPVLELALGDDMDAVFEVPEVMLTGDERDPEVRVAPLDRPDAAVVGRVSEVSPLVDPATGTVQVKVRLDRGVPGLTYGDAVRGETDRIERDRIELPWSAITATARGPAVWVVDPDSGTVALRDVAVGRYETGRVLLSGGLEPGERVVSLGGQLLYPGRSVQAAEAQP